MKKLIALFVTVAALLGMSGCSLFYYEEADTIVKWGFAEKEDSNIIFGLESLLPSAQVLYDAFDDVFYKAGESLGTQHEVVLRAQNGEKQALKNAKKLAEKAAANVPAGHTCIVDYIFVVNIAYEGANPTTTAWSHDYRPKN